MPFTPAAFSAAELLWSRALTLSNDLRAWIAACDGGSVNAHQFLFEFYARRLLPGKAHWQQLAGTPGVAAALFQYKPSQFADATDAASQIAVVQTALNNLATWIESNVRDTLVGTGNWLLTARLEANGSVTERTITGAPSLAALKAQLQTVLDLVSG